MKQKQIIYITVKFKIYITYAHIIILAIDGWKGKVVRLHVINIADLQ